MGNDFDSKNEFIINNFHQFYRAIENRENYELETLKIQAKAAGATEEEINAVIKYCANDIARDENR